VKVFVIMTCFSALAVALALATRMLKHRALDRSNGQSLGNWVPLIYGLISVWGLYGSLHVFFLTNHGPAWAFAFGLAGLWFGCLFNMTDGGLNWLEKRSEARKKTFPKPPTKGLLWDAELDCQATLARAEVPGTLEVVEDFAGVTERS
jgi:hypothetical protein